MKRLFRKWKRTIGRFASSRLQRLDLVLFHLTMWAIVACSFIGIIRRSGLNRPHWLPAGVFRTLDSLPFLYLLISAAGAAILALTIPSLVSRISAVTFVGVTLVLATADTVLDDFKAAFEDLPESGVAFEANRLTGAQRYEYERLSHKLYGISDRLKDPGTLDPLSRERYRRLIDYVGRAAFKENNLTKFLQVTKYLESFRDREPTWDESYLIGQAYLFAAEEQSELLRLDSYRKSVALLEAASKKNSNDVSIRFNLGLAQLKLGYYLPAIVSMKVCVKMDPQIAPQAKWNWAEALKKLGRKQNAINKLKEIPAGAIWKEILEDEAFKDPTDRAFESKFRDLCDSKLS